MDCGEDEDFTDKVFGKINDNQIQKLLKVLANIYDRHKSDKLACTGIAYCKCNYCIKIKKILEG